MKHYSLILISFLFLLSSKSNAQKKVLQNLQTKPLARNSYIDQYTTDDFLASSLSDQEIDPENLDLELLQATLFFVLCDKRVKSHADYKYSPQLSLTAHNFLQNYSANYFRPSWEKKKRLDKKLFKITRRLDYRGPFTSVFFDLTPLFQYNTSKKRRYFLDEKEGVFYYKNKQKDVPLEAISLHTYRSLATGSLRRLQRKLNANRALRSKAYVDLGCVVQFYQSKKKKLPQVKLMWITGAYRLSLLQGLYFE